MSTQNHTVANQFVEALNTGSADQFRALAAPGYTNYTFGQPLDVEGAIHVLDVFRAGFPDLHITHDDTVNEGDKIAARYTARGTHTGPFQGIPPTGKTFVASGINVYVIRNGKIVEERGIFDQMSMMQQLGVIPTPEPAGL